MDNKDFNEYLLFLGNQLKTIRLSLKKNQKDWAAFLEKTQGNVSRMEKTGMGITMDVVQKLSNIHNIDMNWFFKGTGESGLEGGEIEGLEKKISVDELQKDVDELKSDLEKLMVSVDVLLEQAGEK